MEDKNPEQEDADVVVNEDESAVEEKDEFSSTKPRFNLRKVRIPLPDEKFKHMNSKQLADVIRTQLMFLQTSNPMDDDFYYQVHSASQGVPWKGIGFPGQEKSKNRIFRTKDGIMKLNKSNLGRIAVSSIRKPKTYLDISYDGDDTSDGNLFADWALHYLIEEGMKCLMDVEDVDGLSIDGESDELREQRVALDNKLLAYLGITEDSISLFDSDHLLYKFASISKGRILIYRSLLLLIEPFAFQLITVLFGSLIRFCLPTEPHVMDLRAGDAICEVLKRYSLDEATELFAKCVTFDNLDHMAGILASQTGALIFDTFFNTGHELRRSSETPPELVIKWFNVYDRVMESIHRTPSIILRTVVNAELAADEYILWNNIVHMCMHAGSTELQGIREDTTLFEKAQDAALRISSAQYILENYMM